MSTAVACVPNVARYFAQTLTTHSLRTPASLCAIDATVRAMELWRTGALDAHLGRFVAVNDAVASRDTESAATSAAVVVYVYAVPATSETSQSARESIHSLPPPLAHSRPT